MKMGARPGSLPAFDGLEDFQSTVLHNRAKFCIFPHKMRFEKPARADVLHGWKEIAHYLRKGIRTVQRYEQKLGLPVHRIAGKSGSAVLATKAELDAWVNATPVQVNESPRSTSPDQTNQLGVNFLQVDSEIALTFSSIALDARHLEAKIRATRIARKAYAAIVRLRQRFKFTETERLQLDANLKRLKSELERLGEKI